MSNLLPFACSVYPVRFIMYYVDYYILSPFVSKFIMYTALCNCNILFLPCELAIYILYLLFIIWRMMESSACLWFCVLHDVYLFGTHAQWYNKKKYTKTFWTAWNTLTKPPWNIRRHKRRTLYQTQKVLYKHMT